MSEQSKIADRARPDLGRRELLTVLSLTLAGIAAAALSAFFAPPSWRPPGIPLRQSAAVAAAALLMMPVAFSLAKRSGFAESPPHWFVAHVLASAVGIVLAFAHAAGGNLLSAPALLLALSLLLFVQGVYARAHLSRRFATRFAAQVAGFNHPDPDLREHIHSVIERKRALLQTLDPGADEALFSPNLRHWSRKPWQTLRYVGLAQDEAKLVGSRGRAGGALALWRRIHIACAALFVGGLFLHIVLVTFFAGYVAAGEQIYWWHLSAWGGPQ